MPQYTSGTRLRSAVCATEVVVIAAPAEEIVLSCGGVPLLAGGETPPPGATLDASAGEGPQLGKRYTNAAGNLELLCVKRGDGGLACDGEPLQIKGAKPLPSSD